MGSGEEERNCKVSSIPCDHTGDFLQELPVAAVKAPDGCMFKICHKKLQLRCSLGWPGNWGWSVLCGSPFSWNFQPWLCKLRSIRAHELSLRANLRRSKHRPHWRRLNWASWLDKGFRSLSNNSAQFKIYVTMPSFLCVAGYNPRNPTYNNTWILEESGIKSRQL